MFRARPASRAPLAAPGVVKYPLKSATDNEVLEWLDKHSVKETSVMPKKEKVGYRLGPQIVAAKKEEKPSQDNPDSVVWDDFTDEDVLWNCADQADELLKIIKPQDNSENEKKPGAEGPGPQFRTARGSEIAVSKESLERARKMWLEDTEIE